MSDSFDDFLGQSHRLLRERWKSPEALSQEVYAMLLSARRGPDQAAPGSAPQSASSPEARARASQLASRVAPVSGRVPVPVVREPPRPPDPWVGPSTRAEPAPTPNRPEWATPGANSPLRADPEWKGPARGREQPATPRGAPGPAPGTPRPDEPRLPDSPGLAFQREPEDPQFAPPLMDFPEYGVQDDQSGGGLLGLVISGSGSVYQVALYPNGKDAAAGQVVRVTVPQIDSSEQIPANTWIAPVLQMSGPTGTIYSYQPPIWIS